MNYILIFFTLPVLFLVAGAQLKNWRTTRRDGNGADKQRLSLMFGSIAAIGTCFSCLFRWFDGVAFFVSIVPFVGTVLYWHVFITTIHRIRKKNGRQA